jgi:hypothetical protein
MLLPLYHTDSLSMLLSVGMLPPSACSSPRHAAPPGFDAATPPPPPGHVAPPGHDMMLPPPTPGCRSTMGMLLRQKNRN